MLKISLSAARVNAKLTQEEVAKIIKKSKNTVSNWEIGRSEIDQANLAYLCELYGVSIDNIFLPTNLSKRQENEQEGA